MIKSKLKSKCAAVMYSGARRDFFIGTHNFPNRFHPTALTPPPPPKKKILDWRFGYLVSLRVFSAYEWLCRVFESINWCTSIVYHKIRLYHFTGLVTLFCYWVHFVVFKQMQRMNPIWKGADLRKSHWFGIRNLKWIRCLVNSQFFVV